MRRRHGIRLWVVGRRGEMRSGRLLLWCVFWRGCLELWVGQLGLGIWMSLHLISESSWWRRQCPLETHSKVDRLLMYILISLQGRSQLHRELLLLSKRFSLWYHISSTNVPQFL